MKKINKYVYLHLLLFFFSFCGVFSKLAAQNDFLSIKFCIFYGTSILILGIYAILWQQVIKHFEISKAYSHRGIIILWSMLWSVFLFGDTIQWNHLLGAAIIIVGIVVVTKDE